MANNRLAVLESALRARKLDRTLTTALPSLERTDPAACAPTALTGLDVCLHGGLPRGQLSEIAAAVEGTPSRAIERTAGRTTMLLHLVAAATRRGELAAVIDTSDRLDVDSVVAAGADLKRLLWIRGDAAAHDAERRVDRALKALTLVLHGGGFGIVALDLADVPAITVRRLPWTTWLRVQRMVEGSDTACVLVMPEPLARSAGGLTLSLTGQAQWQGESDRSRRLAGLDIAVRVVSPKRHLNGRATVGAIAEGKAEGKDVAVPGTWNGIEVHV